MSEETTQTPETKPAPIAPVAQSGQAARTPAPVAASSVKATVTANRAAPKKFVSNRTPPAKRELPPGWFSVGGLKDSKANVAAAIKSDASIPQHWKDAILAELGNRNVSAVEAHAHAQNEANDFILTVHLKKLF